MRNGNASLLSLFVLCNWCSYPTYEGMETWKKEMKNVVKFSSYPTYEEWKLYWGITVGIGFYVLILPMRNGNLNYLRHYLESQKRSYPTLWGMETMEPFLPPNQDQEYILILPMRNGNSKKDTKERRWHIVLILPMGKWKLELFLGYYGGHKVLILPMRNGNYCIQGRLQERNGKMGSYPTYEEWRTIFIFSIFIPPYVSSYPTYEEWKPSWH